LNHFDLYLCLVAAGGKPAYPVIGRVVKGVPESAIVEEKPSTLD